MQLLALVYRSGGETKEPCDETDLLGAIALCRPSNLSFADHVHCFIALDRSFYSGKRAEAEARIDPPFDRTVILLDNIVEVRDNAAATSLAECMILLQFVNNLGIRRVPVHIDHPRARVTWCRQRFAEEYSSGRRVASLGKKKVNRCAQSSPQLYIKSPPLYINRSSAQPPARTSRLFAKSHLSVSVHA